MKLIGRSGAAAGREVNVRESLNIGTAPDNDLRIDSPGISRHHAQIVWRDGEYWIEDHSTNGTLLNGRRVVRARLDHRDVITVGHDVDLTVVVSEEDEKPTAIHSIRSAWLEPIGPEVGPRMLIPPGEITIGRSAPSTVLVNSPVVSHMHARIEREPDRLVVFDLNSSNGTFVNGLPIDGPIELGDGDVLSVARAHQFRVSIDRPPKREGQTPPASKPRLPAAGVSFPKGPTERVAAARRSEQSRSASARATPSMPIATYRPAAVPAPVPAPMTLPFRCVMLRGGGQMFKLGVGRHDVGRSENAAVMLLSPQVSRIQAVIVLTPTGASVEDAGSANGTAINGVRISAGGTAAIKSGDRLAFGNLEFVVELLT